MYFCFNYISSLTMLNSIYKKKSKNFTNTLKMYNKCIFRDKIDQILHLV